LYVFHEKNYLIKANIARANEMDEITRV
jgi:hypothetical protein